MNTSNRTQSFYRQQREIEIELQTNSKNSNKQQYAQQQELNVFLLNQQQNQETYVNMVKFIQKYQEHNQKFQNLSINKNATAVLIIGQKKVGKSSIYHVLKGDKLEKDNKNQFNVQNPKGVISSICMEESQQTQTPNIYNYNDQFDIIDTPGFQDLNSTTEEIIVSFHLRNLINKYSQVIIILVIEFNSQNIQCIEEPINLISSQLSKEHLKYLCMNNRILMVLNKIESQNNNFLETTNQFLKQIKNKANPEDHDITSYFLKHEQSNFIVPLKKFEEIYNQKAFFQNIYDFLNLKRNHLFTRFNFKQYIYHKHLIQNIQQLVIDLKKQILEELKQFLDQFNQECSKLTSFIQLILYDKLKNIFNEDQFLDNLYQQLKEAKKFYEECFNQNYQSPNNRLNYILIILKNKIISFFKEIMKGKGALKDLDYIQNGKFLRDNIDQLENKLRYPKWRSLELKKIQVGQIQISIFLIEPSPENNILSTNFMIINQLPQINSIMKHYDWWFSYKVINQKIFAYVYPCELQDQQKKQIGLHKIDNFLLRLKFNYKMVQKL